MNICLNIVETVFKSFIYISFPIMCYLLYVGYSKNINKKENDLFLDFALLISLYLYINYTNNTLFLFDIILFLAYIKKRNKTAILISLIIIFYCVSNYNYNIYLLLIEYSSYFFIYLSCTDKNKISASLFKTLVICDIFWLSFNIQYYDIHICSLKNVFLNTSLYVLAICILYSLSYILVYYGERIFEYNLTLKELEQEKQIRNSLFKITHEIKNPIAVCKGYLDMFDVNNKEHAFKYIPIIKDEIKKTLVLLQDFLSMTKITITKEILDINFLIENVIDNMKFLINDKKIELNVDLIDDEIFIEGDYNRLTQVLTNVIKNAIEALEEIRNAKIDIYTVMDTSYFKIYVCDNGIGISEEDLKKIKDAFFTTKEDGTGLGLSLSNEIIKAHGGTMNFISKKNKGTSVEIILPLS